MCTFADNLQTIARFFIFLDVLIQDECNYEKYSIA